MKILVATEKPFAKKATDEMRNIAQSAGVELVLLEKYTDVNDFYRAVETVDGLIVRSDKVTKEVVAHLHRTQNRLYEYSGSELECCGRACHRYDDIYGS